MDLSSLRCFRVVARHEHISRAAAELRVAQPSVSRTIARLEAELGVPLFDRQGRQIRLNRYGAAFLRRVERGLGELDDARRELADATGLDHGGVAVAAETPLTLIGPVAAFQAAHPDVTFRLYQSTPQAMRRQLHARDVDFCVASQPLADPALHEAALLREEVLLSVPQDHPLARHDRVPVSALAGERLITTRPGRWPRELLERLCAAEGITPVIACEVDEPGAIHFLVSAGVGIGLVPAMSRRAMTRPPIAWLHLDTPDCRRTLSLVRLGDAYLSTVARSFLDLVVDMFSSEELP